MDPTKDVFDMVVSTLTGGIFNDLKTAMIGLVAVWLVLLGVGLLYKLVYGVDLGSERTDKMSNGEFERREDNKIDARSVKGD